MPLQQAAAASQLNALDRAPKTEYIEKPEFLKKLAGSSAKIKQCEKYHVSGLGSVEPIMSCQTII